MSLLRRQLPVRSPLTLAAALAPLGLEDARPAVQGLLEREYTARAAILTGSGTHALRLAFELVKQRYANAPIAMPAYACFDLATAAIGAGVRVRLYDLNPYSLQPDLESLRRAVGDDAAAVVLVHLYGIPVPVAAVRAIAVHSGAVIIEDCAQSIGAMVGKTAAGLQGDLSVLSFGRGKGVTGGGGALLVTDEFRDAALSRLAQTPEGQTSRSGFLIKGLAQWALARPGVYGIPSRIPFLRLGETVYHEPTVVTQMPPAAARALLHTWHLRTTEIQRRRENAEALLARLPASGPSRTISGVEGTRPSWLRLPVLLPPVSDANRRTAAACGIVPAYPMPLSDLANFSSVLDNPNPSVPGSRTLAKHLWTAPTHSAVQPKDLERVVRWVRNACMEF